MEILKKPFVKYLIVAIVIFAFVCAILLIPIIIADFPKKWTYYGVACVTAGIISFGLLVLCDLLSDNSSKSSKLFGGLSRKYPEQSMVSAKVDDLFS